MITGLLKLHVIRGIFIGHSRPTNVKGWCTFQIGPLLAWKIFTHNISINIFPLPKGARHKGPLNAPLYVIAELWRIPQKIWNDLPQTSVASTVRKFIPSVCKRTGIRLEDTLSISSDRDRHSIQFQYDSSIHRFTVSFVVSKLHPNRLFHQPVPPLVTFCAQAGINICLISCPSISQNSWLLWRKGTITSKIKHEIKLKTSPVSLAGLVLSFIACFIVLVIAP